MIYDIALSHIRSISALKVRALVEAFGSAENIFTAHKDAFDNLGAVKKYFTDEKFKSELLQKAEAELKFITEKNIRVLRYGDDNFPYRMKECVDAPNILYLTSDIDLDKGKYVSVVGTRKCTSYGKDLSHKLVSELKEMIGDELTIVSGLAHGIDVAAHRAAVDCGVRTIGVVAHGLDTIYPAANRNVAANMVKHGGAVLTEYPTKTQPIASNFLARNRIIAGLCDTLVVAESASKGGALVTANIANGYGRSVYAFPGRVGDAASAGCNMLLRTMAAGLISGAEDLAKAESWDVQKKPKQQEIFTELSADKKAVIDLLQQDALHIADLSLALGMNASILLPLLIEMEMDGLIQGVAGGRYRQIIR